jgi:C-terminal AAA-associated domain
MDLDDLLPVVEAGEILGFLRVQEGDLLLGELGQGYAEASILTRKELVAGRVLRLPLISGFLRPCAKMTISGSRRTTSWTDSEQTSATRPKISFRSRSSGDVMRSCSASTTTRTSCSWKAESHVAAP